MTLVDEQVRYSPEFWNLPYGEPPWRFYETTEVIDKEGNILRFKLEHNEHFTWFEVFALDALYRLVPAMQLSLYFKGRIIAYVGTG